MNFKIITFTKQKTYWRKNHNSKYIEKIDYQNPFKKSSLISMLAQHIIVKSFIQ
jgi:hypothetical protein